MYRNVACLGFAYKLLQLGLNQTYTIYICGVGCKTFAADTQCLTNFKGELFMKTRISLLLSALVLISSQAFAEPPQRRAHDPGVNARQDRQDHRIQQGVRSGEITRDEAKQLRQERRDIKQEERAYKADGKLTREERKDLHQDLNDLSKDIYREKHDGEKRPRVR